MYTNVPGRFVAFTEWGVAPLTNVRKNTSKNDKSSLWRKLEGLEIAVILLLGAIQ